MDETHNPGLRSWVESANDGTTDFPIQNLPLGVFRRRESGEALRVGVAIGNEVFDLARASKRGLLAGLSDGLRAAVAQPSLNGFAARDVSERSQLRRRLVELLRVGSPLADPSALVPMKSAELSLPVDAGDYTDFYASIFHATNVGRMFRPDNPLLPNYKYLPIAYHGRSSSLIVSGTHVVRPSGQTRTGDQLPAFGPTGRLDYEVEVGMVVGPGNARGTRIPIEEAEQHIVGLCLVNDWSARDIQAWEYQPLGPFLAKSFATTISPWVVTIDALVPFRCPAFERPADDPAPLAHLTSADASSAGVDVTVEVFLQSAEMRRLQVEPVRVSRGSFRDIYWTIAQMLTHQTSNGCNVRPGDLLASGTISGRAKGSEGCLLERSRDGAIELPTGEHRTFLADGDTVIMRGVCERAGFARIGFGDCVGTVEPAP